MACAMIKSSLLRFCAHLLIFTLLFRAPLHNVSAATNPWDAYNQAPISHTLAPSSIYTTFGQVYNETSLLHGSATRLNGANSSVTVDFGKDVRGIITISFARASDANQRLGLAFSVSSLYVGTISDASSGISAFVSTDGAIYASVNGTGTYTMPDDKLRGGFRYLTLFLNSTGWVDVNGVSLNFTASPNMVNPAAYPNYFYCNDDLLNRIWFAGAYTVQLNTINPTQGRSWLPPASGWENNGTVGVGSEVLVDGAKRDRQVWPGDLGISIATAYVSTGDLLGSKNALITLYQYQLSTGELPYAGPVVPGYGSDTYHMWTLIGTYDYYLYSADKNWLDVIWPQYQHGITFITDKIGTHGLLNVTGIYDWGRNDQGGENIEANVLLYAALTTGTVLAQAEGNGTLAKTYKMQATNLKTQINHLLWDATAGAFQDNRNGGNLYPQDGNSLAVWYGVVNTSTQVRIILEVLRNNWDNLGSQTPEWYNNISPFIGSMEVKARFEANDDQDALTLVRKEWGYMLNDPRGTNSTMWESFNSSGDFASGPVYTSLAHGWSTGPTPALTNYVLGIAPDRAGGQEYHVIPHPGNLTHVEGSLMAAPSKNITTTYDIDSCGKFSMTVDSVSNTLSTGVIGVPLFGQSRTIAINGNIAWNGSAFQGASGISSADQDSNYVYFRGVQPGKYKFGYTGNSCDSTIGYSHCEWSVLIYVVLMFFSFPVLLVHST